MHIVYAPDTDIRNWREAVGAADASRQALSLAYHAPTPGWDPSVDVPERVRDEFDRLFPFGKVRLVALHSPCVAAAPGRPEIPMDRPDLRQTARTKLLIDLAKRLRIPYVACDGDGGALHGGVLRELGLYAGKRRVRLPVSMGAVNATAPDEMRRLFLTCGATAVGWLYDPGELARRGNDPVGALERAGDFIFLARLRAQDLTSGAFDAASVLRALTDWYDGDLELAVGPNDDAAFAESARRICEAAPGFDRFAAPTDHTKKSFPSSVGRLVNGQGRAQISPPSPHRAGSLGTWRVTFTVGPDGIATGGSVHIRPGHPSDWAVGQTHDPAGVDCVTAAIRGDSAAKIAVRVRPMAAATHGVEVRVVEGRLSEGDVIEVVFGDTAGGSPGLRCQTYEEKGFRLFVAVDKEGDGLFRELPNPPRFDVVGGPPDHIAMAAPAVVRPGEPFTLLLRAEDRFLNVSTEAYGPRLELSGPGVDGLPDSWGWPEPDRAIGRIEGLTCATEGILHIRALDPTTGATGISTPVKCASTGPRVYWGDIHSHSSQMDGTDTPERNFLYARDVAGLDFYSMADHVDVDTHICELSRPEQWAEVVKHTQRFDDPGRFVTLLGYEIAEDEGDYNVYYRVGDAPWYIPATTPWELYRWLRAHRLGAVVIPHMSSYPVPTRGYDLNYYDPEFTRLIEICSCHGMSEYFGGPQPLVTCQPGGYVREALARGQRMGFIGSGDGHQGRPGNTRDRYDNGLVAVFADELTREAVFDALYARACYAATNARILVEFHINGVPMGQELTVWEPERYKHVRALVGGTGPLLRVELVKNGDVVDTVESDGLVCEYRYTDDRPTHSSDYYYLRVTQRDGNMAWSSPVWVRAGDRTAAL